MSELEDDLLMESREGRRLSDIGDVVDELVATIVQPDQVVRIGMLLQIPPGATCG